MDILPVIEYNQVSQIDAPFDCANSRRALSHHDGGFPS